MDSDSFELIGLDFGSTTSSCLIARTTVGKNCVTGRMEFGDYEQVFRSEPVFTPFGKDNQIDERAICHLLETWLSHAQKQHIVGGAIITGLASQSENVSRITSLIKSKIGESVIATAKDPQFESWLAFMGSVASLSRAYPQKWILNLDIGGGTTNIALGKNGDVVQTSCLFVGARHFQFKPGTYEITHVSSHGRKLLEELEIERQGTLIVPDRNKIINSYLKQLEIETSKFHSVTKNEEVIRTFSGGVGQLIYQILSKKALPTQTYFGDLGIELAQGVFHSSLINKECHYIPKQMGRATVYGLTLHSTEVSGTTLFLSDADLLPLTDVPILGSLYGNESEEEVLAVIERIQTLKREACIQVHVEASDLERIKKIGTYLSKGLKKYPETALVLLVSQNCGHTLGSYATDWKKIPSRVVVIDEIPHREANFVNIGRMRHNVVPVSFYGF